MATSPSDEQAYEGGAKVSVSVWTTARSGPQWKVRVTEEADEELIDLVVRRAVAAYRKVEAKLARKPKAPFEGQEPTDQKEAA